MAQMLIGPAAYVHYWWTVLCLCVMAEYLGSSHFHISIDQSYPGSWQLLQLAQYHHKFYTKNKW